MCGICGAISLDGPLALPPDAPGRMIGSLRHRGPDEFGAWRDERVFLGHSRLSIIDIASGQQPMGGPDGRIRIVFNGEIFNYVELAKELSGLGHAFRTTSDTEVIIAAYRQWGDDCVERFNGQFAFVLYDTAGRRIFLARDRFGIRPLFTARHGDLLLFGSEIKAIGAWPGYGINLNPAGIGEIFNFWVNISPSTPFNGVFQLPPGHVGSIDLGAEGNASAELRTRRYWYPDFLPAEEDHCFVSRAEQARMAAKVRDALVDATTIRLRADVPVGAYLSGGLDSSATAAIVASESDSFLKTFSVGFRDPAYDERSWQDMMSERLGTDHDTITVGDAEVAGRFREVVWHAETPLLGTAPSPLFSLSGLVRDQAYKVVLTGEGADEVFCGYNIFREAKVRNFWARQPRSSLRPQLLGRLYPYLKQSPVSFLTRFYGAGLVDGDPFFSHRPRWKNTGGAAAFFSPETATAVDLRSVERRMLESLPEDYERWGPVARAQYLEMTTFLSGYLLCSQGDRMLMGNSVEGRFPFLDHKLAAVAASIPASVKLQSLREKAILKRAVADLLPVEILDRPKQPYRAPDSASFFVGAGSETAEAAFAEDVIRDVGIFDPRKVSLLVRKWRAGKLVGSRDNMAFTGILSTMLLADLFGPAFEGMIRDSRLDDDQIAWRHTSVTE